LADARPIPSFFIREETVRRCAECARRTVRAHELPGSRLADAGDVRAQSPLTPLKRLAQVLLRSNEFAFVD
jgi:hypothetical protein